MSGSSGLGRGVDKDYERLSDQPGTTIAEETFYLATRWSDPERDVWLARELALDLLKRDRLFCVWNGKRLKGDSVDIDHCFPWSAWPCGDLWNLLPTLRSVNQNQKSDRLPSVERFTKAKGIILDWWSAAYTNNANWIFDGMEFQRLRLHHDQPRSGMGVKVRAPVPIGNHCFARESDAQEDSSIPI